MNHVPLIMVSGLLLSAVIAEAQTINVNCREQAGDASPRMTFVYDGDAEGTLTVKASFGEMTLPATREEQEGEIDGQKYSVIGIRAFGETSALMPDQAALDQCIADRLKQNPTDDGDIRFMQVLACQEKAEQKTQAPVTAAVTLSISDPPAADVSVNRTYVEPSAVTGKRIALESFPANCVMTD